ncbi:reverse transcriptase RNA-dependent DNA polymerase [Nitzschia inconspicua]|uniref:Reverse transcriptase RNA-dependent DNA polymerase n=1 Tax=Nitzschia inconspicua TaxID=303405 RepID=A0A9K3Q3Q5_9STRA|nr:reverse transcriptase RNA-dependent DNA polymerase [Nitzschia inconspicua]
MRLNIGLGMQIKTLACLRSCWQKRVSPEIGFQRLPSKRSIYVKKTAEGMTMVLNAVDDQLYFGTTIEMKDWFDKETKRRFDVQKLGQAECYLQSRITQLANYSIILDQSASRYAALVAERYLSPVNEDQVPILVKVKYGSPLPSERLQLVMLIETIYATHANAPLILFTSASFQNCPDTSKSTYGYLIFMRGGVVNNSSHFSRSCMPLQDCHATSGLMAAAFIWKVFNDIFGFNADKPLTISLGIDSQSAMDMGNKETSQTRHIRTVLSLCSLCTINSETALFKVDGTRNPSNSMTKVLTVTANQLDEEAAIYQGEVDPVNDTKGPGLVMVKQLSLDHLSKLKFSNQALETLNEADLGNNTLIEYWEIKNQNCIINTFEYSTNTFIVDDRSVLQ